MVVQLDLEGVLLRLRFPRFVERARVLHGEEVSQAMRHRDWEDDNALICVLLL